MTYKVLNDTYEVIYKRNKRMVRIITRYRDGKICISGPKRMSEQSLTEVLDKGRSFLERAKPTKESVDELHLFGKIYPYSIVLSSNNYVLFENNEIIINVRENETALIKKTISSFYKEQIKLVIEQNLSQCLSYYDLDFTPSVDYSYAKSYLGECFYNQKRLRFSGYLAKCDMDTIIQTIHHEICHFYVHSHSSEFKSMLYTKCNNQGILIKNVRKFNDLY